MVQPKDKTVLIVDDDQETADFLNFTVSKEGFNTRTAGDGSQVLELIKDINFDLILLDMKMPGKTGFEVIKALQAYEYRHIPILVISGKFNMESLSSWMHLEPNVKDYLVKPVNPEYLLYKVHLILGTVPPKAKEVMEKRQYTEQAGAEPQSDNQQAIETENIRQYTRMPADILTDMYDPRTQKSLGIGFLRDISLSGVGIKSDSDIPTGTEVHFKTKVMYLELDFFGRVIRKKKTPQNIYDYGIKFSRLKLFQRIVLKKRIEKWLKLKPF
jgi:CheY-like chemotaxis protein